MIVLDASALANALADDGDDGAAVRAELDGQDLAAPDLVDIETMAVLRKRWIDSTLTDDRFGQAVDDLSHLPMTRYPALPLLAWAFELKANVTAFDAAYVALAEALDAPLLTADRRLARAAGPRCELRVVSAP
ncbi:MAG: type II toxin-antitoxin system VapC family toxin [Actinomycetota bacterium]